MPTTATTADVLRARGAKTRKTLRLDRLAGLWSGIQTWRTSGGFSSTAGVPRLWERAALRRARLIAKARASGMLRPAIAEHLRELGEIE
jgi:hypothetical protein